MPWVITRRNLWKTRHWCIWWIRPTYRILKCFQFQKWSFLHTKRRKLNFLMLCTWALVSNSPLCSCLETAFNFVAVWGWGKMGTCKFKFLQEFLCQFWSQEWPKHTTGPPVRKLECQFLQNLLGSARTHAVVSRSCSGRFHPAVSAFCVFDGREVKGVRVACCNHQNPCRLTGVFPQWLSSKETD